MFDSVLNMARVLNIQRVLNMLSSSKYARALNTPFPKHKKVPLSQGSEYTFPKT